MTTPSNIPWNMILRKSAKVALVVGVILNCINQPEAIFGDEPIHVLKAALTFAVPFCVSTYGAVTALKASQA